MAEPVCKRCSDRQWLCEQHPNEPFEHIVNGKECPGPGDPCPECNELARPSQKAVAEVTNE